LLNHSFEKHRTCSIMNTVSKAVLLLLSVPASIASSVSTSNFEGLWRGLDTDDGSEIGLSIICADETKCTITYKDKAWNPETCKDFGTVVNDYDLDGNTLSAPIFGPVLCNDGAGGQAATNVTFDDPDFVLQGDGSLLWYNVYRFWKISKESGDDFRGFWMGFDTDDGSELVVSITGEGDTYDIFYSDTQWNPNTCESFGTATNTYTMDGNALIGPVFGPVKCNDGAGGLIETNVTFGDPDFVLQENGSLLWYSTYRFWPIGGGESPMKSSGCAPVSAWSAIAPISATSIFLFLAQFESGYL
jgi:hypothetical protein